MNSKWIENDTYPTVQMDKPWEHLNTSHNLRQGVPEKLAVEQITWDTTENYLYSTVRKRTWKQV